MEPGSLAGMQPVWTAKHAAASVKAEAAYSGAGGLQITADANRTGFSVSTTMTYKKGAKTKFYDRTLRDWKLYRTVSVMIRNDGAKPVTLQSLRLYTGKVRYLAPEVNGSGEACIVIPADGQWHRLTFDLDKLYLQGDECGPD